jgi:hypothetical protein
MSTLEKLRECLPPPRDLPYDPFRAGLYTRDELMEGWEPGLGHSATLDGRIFEWVRRHGGRSPEVEEGLRQRIHDHAIDVGVAEVVSRRGGRIVGIMGSAVATARDPEYARVVRLARELTLHGFLVATGGGPGLMEAANLGAFLSSHDDDAVEDALEALREAPAFGEDDAGYLAAAARVRERFQPGGESLGIPTWVYEGEPVGQFSSHIAKYFSNSIREDGLLSVCISGIVYAPGRAGTSQEIFQDAAQNAYSRPHAEPSPMAFYGVHHYEAHSGLWPAVRRQEELWGPYPIELSDDVGRIVDFIERNQPEATLARVEECAAPGVLRLIQERVPER